MMVNILNSISITLVLQFFTCLFLCIFFIFIVKKSAVNIYDPLFYFFVIFLIPAIFGLFLSGIFWGTFTYFLICSLIFVYVIIILLFRPVRDVNLEDNLPKDFQFILLFFFLMITISNFYINVYLSGNIPLFSTQGVENRFLATQNSRVLYWMNLSVNTIPLVLFAISSYRRVRLFAFFSFIVAFIISLMMASKGAILSFVIMEILVLFVSKARNDVKRFRYHKKISYLIIILTMLVIPIYLVKIGVGHGSDEVIRTIIVKLLIRFFYAFDQLIPASQLDLLNNQYMPDSQIGLNLIQYQFLSYYKSISGMSVEYNSIGEFIIYKLYGQTYSSPHAYPNSNLILECLLTSGIILGSIFFIIEVSAFLFMRKLVLSKSINTFSIIFVVAIVFAPYDIFLSGYEWINRFIFLTVYIFISWAIYYLLANVSQRMKL
ncbi:oligosaccharide repeat unit polymerase [Vibrio gazogenes]|uniref:Oligosaccharide repeat unit polymerase n=1 Tax=Vibrio gazogenes TaxID=687 RepID=A0A1Z2SFL1_VIBGA|nr:oligosaccharide repeat unit polymerase [Vibrio gazogenes]ASA55973.1 hypothetical protein BSQ33_09890 [Vibrio gazogenes]